MKEINLKDKPLSDVVRNITSILGVPKAPTTDDRNGFIIERTSTDSSLYHVLILKKFVDPQTREATYSVETEEGTMSPRKSVKNVKYKDLNEMKVFFPNVLIGEEKKILFETLDTQGLKKSFEIRRDTFATHMPEPPKEHVQKMVQNFKEGEVIFEEGTEGAEMYIIQKGSIGLFKKSLVGEMQLAELKVNSFFGEMALMGNPNRSASARALEDSELLVITKELFEFQLNKVPNWFITMFKTLIERLRNANEMIKTLQKQLTDKTPQPHGQVKPEAAAKAKTHAKEVAAEQHKASHTEPHVTEPTKPAESKAEQSPAQEHKSEGELPSDLPSLDP